MTKFKLLGTVAILSTLIAAQPQAYATEGREVAAPPWSAACMTDQGPSQCGEPMWVYGPSGRHVGQRWRQGMKGFPHGMPTTNADTINADYSPS